MIDGAKVLAILLGSVLTSNFVFSRFFVEHSTLGEQKLSASVRLGAVVALIAVIALVLLFAGYRGAASLEVALLAAGSALALLAVDLIYVGKRTIAPVYLLDAVAETAILAAWAVAWMTRF